MPLSDLLFTCYLHVTNSIELFRQATIINRQMGVSVAFKAKPILYDLYTKYCIRKFLICQQIVLPSSNKCNQSL